MQERQLPGVKRLTLEMNRALFVSVKIVRTGHVALLSDERVSAKTCLQPDLVATSGPKPHL